eukprot:c264_g1_i1.p1 GENE.c264_g1_i1~~c264_g1_i1.p1  ORF type:complete len:311 (+),score=52.42 c264_g1_i1:80-934(+)
MSQEPVNNQDEAFRDYASSKRHALVEHHYRMMRQNQTLEYVLRVKEHFGKLNHGEMTIWEAFEQLNDFVDASDPDTAAPNMIHMLQTAESMRAAGQPDWMQLTGLIHDLGKMIYRFGGGSADGQDGNGGEQWGIAGDTFIVGCELPSCLVFPQFNELNPDMANPKLNTPLGIYTKGCGLHNAHCAFGHDEYLYMVLKGNPTCTLPQDALDVIRFHSLYGWHQGGAYRDLMTESDHRMLEVVKSFQKFDLYTKHGEELEWGEGEGSLKHYYQSLVDKYLPGKLHW